MANVAFVTDAQHRVPRTECPSCGAPHLDFRMRCDVGTTECLFRAHCDHCHAAFDLDADSFPATMTVEEIESGRILCDRCQRRLAVVTFVCETTSQGCRYTLKCPHCDGL